jgi:hypothetical protein
MRMGGIFSSFRSYLDKFRDDPALKYHAMAGFITDGGIRAVR